MTLIPSHKHLTGRGDLDIWDAAQKTGRLLITQDLDFSDVRRFAPGTHCGLMLVRLRHPDRKSLLRRVRDVFQYEDVNSWPGCFVVATERKVRIVRPQR